MDVGRSSTLGALRHREFQLLFAGYTLAGLGQWMQQFALGWLVVGIAVAEGNLTVAALYLGVMRLVGAVPALGLGLYAGVLADRMDRRTLLIRARAISSVVALLLAIHVAAGPASYPVVVILAAANIGAFSFDLPARQAMLSTIVPRRDLVSAVGLSRGSIQLAHAFGPLLGGILVIPFGVPGVFFTKAALDILSVVALVLMRGEPIALRAATEDRRVRDALKEGMVHVGREPLLRWSVLLFAVVVVFGNTVNQLIPVLAVETLHVGAVEVSWMIAALGVGALGGSVAVAGSGKVARTGVLLLVAMVATGIALSGLGLQRDVTGAIAALLALGIAQQTFNGTQAVILQVAAPERLRARVVGLQPVLVTAGTPFGVFLVGSLGAFAGTANAFVFAGAVVTAVALIAVLRLDHVRDLRLRIAPTPLTVAAETSLSAK